MRCMALVLNELLHQKNLQCSCFFIKFFIKGFKKADVKKPTCRKNNFCEKCLAKLIKFTALA